MNNVQVPLREIELIAITRVALGFGLGLLASSYLSSEKRKWIGWTLAAIGAASTIPLRRDVLNRVNRPGGAYEQPSLADLVQN